MTLAKSLKLAQQARAVQTREDLAAFVSELKADLDANPDDWENADLPSFLDAMGGWIGDMHGYYANTGQVLSELSPWTIFAHILIASRSYE